MASWRSTDPAASLDEIPGHAAVPWSRQPPPCTSCKERTTSTGRARRLAESLRAGVATPEASTDQGHHRSPRTSTAMSVLRGGISMRSRTTSAGRERSSAASLSNAASSSCLSRRRSSSCCSARSTSSFSRRLLPTFRIAWPAERAFGQTHLLASEHGTEQRAAERDRRRQLAVAKFCDSSRSMRASAARTFFSRESSLAA